MNGAPILILGGYGLAGRAIVEGLIAQTRHDVIAAGRNPERLRLLHESIASGRLSTTVLDVADRDQLLRLCTDASLVINAVGPYARHGADIARAVVETGKPYIDCANEQVHYNRLKDLDSLARDRSVPMVTAAGAIPGVSGLLAAHLLGEIPNATRINMYWAQFRNVDEQSGVASLLSGILEIGHEPVALTNGAQKRVSLGKSISTVELPEPFGKRRMLEAPSIECLTLPSHFELTDVHTWFYFGEMPLWIFGLIRVLKPHRRNWAYLLIKRITTRINEREVAEARQKNHGPEGLLLVTVENGSDSRTNRILFKDGAVATAALPIRIADRILSGRWDGVGLVTPLDVFDPAEALSDLGDCVVHSDLDFS